MRISTNTLTYINQHYGSAGDVTRDGIDELVRKVGGQLGEVEAVTNFGDKYNDVIIARIVSCDPHPNADRLKVCKIDDGGVREGLERDGNGHVQVVCGAQNARAGILVLWLPPGATVPESWGTTDPFVLEARELRGVVSNGMLASPRELALNDTHEGIFEISHPSDQGLAPGTYLLDACHLRDDKIIDIENKMFTHRPDCFGLIGVAREIEGIHHRSYKSPEWYHENANIAESLEDELPLVVRNELPGLVPRFTAITMRDVTIRQSPLWLQVDLIRHGLRPVNNIVDYTNWYMLLTGQPLHAYDYDKVKGQDEGDRATIVVRYAQDGEKIALLNGKEITPRNEAIMIATEKKLIGLGGVMGGAYTEVDESTKNIIIECANFDMYSIRRTSMAHGLFTDAVTRFNKGQSPRQNRMVLAKIVDQIQKNNDGRVAGKLIDQKNEEFLSHTVTISADFINQRLGLSLRLEEIANLLKNVEFIVHESADRLEIEVPFWRQDINIREDIVEEVGRLYGYDHLPLALPLRQAKPTHKNSLLELKNELRHHLARYGANEVLTYSFVHGDLLAKVGQDKTNAFELSNALSPDLQYYRLSLAPSLLEKIHGNIKAGYRKFAFFEIGKAHIVGHYDEDGLPEEFERLAVVVTADEKEAPRGQAAYYQAKNYLEQLLALCGLVDDVSYEPIDIRETDSATLYYNKARAATVRIGDTVLGRIGEYNAHVRQKLKLPRYTAGFEISVTSLQSLRKRQSRYRALSKYPKIEQDICFRVPVEVRYQELRDFVATTLERETDDATRCGLAPIDIYQREQDERHKQITFRVTLVSHEVTLENHSVNELLDLVAREARASLAAERV